MPRRIRITVSYNGAGFHGWQVQSGLPTIQGTLEAILAEIESAPVQVAGSGRTDAGVHAEAQVAAFDLTNPIPAANLRRAMNRLLPPAIRVMAAEEVHASFHPRFDAIAKTYEYRIYRGETCSPFLWPTVYHHPYRLDVDRMIGHAQMFEGEHDFSAFAAADDSDALGRSKVRTIFSSLLVSSDDFVVYRVRGSGFLKHMVRNLTGTLIEVGRGNISTEQLRSLLANASGRCGATVPAKGLTLLSVEYPALPEGT